MFSYKAVEFVTFIISVLSITVEPSFRIKILDKECYLDIGATSSSDFSLDNINDKNVFWDCNGTGSIWYWHGTEYNSSLYTNQRDYDTIHTTNYYLKYAKNDWEEHGIPSNQFNAFVTPNDPSSAPIITYQHYTTGSRILISSCSCGSMYILQHADDFKSVYHKLDGSITTGSEATWTCNSSHYMANYSRITLVPTTTSIPTLEPTNYPTNIPTETPVIKNTNILRIRAPYTYTSMTSTKNMIFVNVTTSKEVLTKHIIVTPHESRSHLFLMIISAVGGALFCCIICLIFMFIINWKKDKGRHDNVDKRYDTTINVIHSNNLPMTEMRETLTKSHDGKEYVETEDHELTDSEFCVQGRNYKRNTLGFDVVNNEYNNPNIQDDEFIIDDDDEDEEDEEEEKKDDNDNAYSLNEEESIDMVQLELMNKILMGRSEDAKDVYTPNVMGDEFRTKNINCDCHPLSVAVTKEYDSDNELIVEGNDVTPCMSDDDRLLPTEGTTLQ